VIGLTNCHTFPLKTYILLLFNYNTCTQHKVQVNHSFSNI
jgi:hypothetical protein